MIHTRDHLELLEASCHKITCLTKGPFLIMKARNYYYLPMIAAGLLRILVMALVFIVQPAQFCVYGFQDRQSQSAGGRHSDLYGKVIDNATKAPLHGANVFIAGTMIGCATDREGAFSLQNVPAGSHELIVSMMGYHLQKLKITQGGMPNQPLVFKMEQRVLQAPEIIISLADIKKREKRLETFIKYFIGETKNSSKCKILNPESILIEEDEDTKEMRAWSEEEIVIENRGLGYTMKYVLENFLLTDSLVSFEGKQFFSELTPKNKRESKKWRKNRLKAYRGSLRHFLHALCSNALASEGYEAALYQGGNNLYWGVASSLFRPQLVLKKAKHESERILSFTGMVIIFYTRESEPMKYRRLRKRKASRKRARHQQSWLQLRAAQTTIDVLGRSYQPIDILKGGYMGWELLSEALPWEYLPEK